MCERLEQAVEAYRAALEVYTRDRVPRDWAATQVNLGNTLLTLGQQESGTARLDEAVAAYRAALAVFTREDAPLQWAQVQNNLGNALRALGERESGTAHDWKRLAALDTHLIGAWSTAELEAEAAALLDGFDRKAAAANAQIDRVLARLGVT